MKRSVVTYFVNYEVYEDLQLRHWGYFFIKLSSSRNQTQDYIRESLLEATRKEASETRGFSDNSKVRIVNISKL